MTRAIFICAGDGTRWGNYLGREKHLIEIEGEILIHRAVRLARRHTDDVYVVSKPGDTRYEVPGATRWDAELSPRYGDADKFLSSSSLWHPTDRTVVFYGDVWYDENAMATIFPDRDDWTLYCRFGGSEFTGYGYGECFAVGFHPSHHEEYKTALLRVADLKRRGKLKRCGGWETYRAMNSVPDARMRQHRRYGRAVEIDSWVDDFDKPGDYDRWMARRKEAKR